MSKAKIGSETKNEDSSGNKGKLTKKSTRKIVFQNCVPKTCWSGASVTSTTRV